MSSAQQLKEPYNLFYCYADKDQSLLNKLEAHLSALKREGEIKASHRRDISAGKNWEDELTKFMNRSSIILLLISPNFLHSDYNYSYKMAYAIKRREAKRAVIIPIILRPCDWEKIPFGEHQVLSDYEVLPQNQQAVTTWGNQDRAFAEIAQGIRQAVQNLREYAEEIRTNQINPIPKSICPNKVNIQQPETIKTNQPSSRTATKARNSTNRKTVTKSQRNAQTNEVGTIATEWDKKSIRRAQFFFKLKREYFTFDSLGTYRRGTPLGMFLFFLAFDVGGLSVLSKDWPISQQLPGLIFVLSILMFLWGAFNRNDFVAIGLASAFGITWLLVGLHYLPWHLMSITIAVLVISFVLFIGRLFLFLGHQKQVRRVHQKQKRRS